MEFLRQMQKLKTYPNFYLLGCQRLNDKNRDVNLDKGYTAQISQYQVLINSSVINAILYFMR